MKIQTHHSGKTPPKSEWTILAYLGGKNDLSREIRANLRAIEKQSPRNGIAVAVQAGFIKGGIRAPGEEFDPRKVKGEVARYATAPGKRLRLAEKLSGAVNMGYSPTLQKFLEWGIRKFPAKHYLICINNHGGGFLGISRDHKGKSTISLPSLGKTLENVRERTGVTPDVLLFDACLMGQAEVVAQIGKNARFVVASEEEITAQGLPWGEIMGIFQDHPSLSPESVARGIVSAVREDEAIREEKGLDRHVFQIAALKGGVEKKLLHALDQLAGALLPASVPAQAILEVVKKTRRFDDGGEKKPYRDYRDMVDFVDNLQKSDIRSTRVKEAATALKKVAEEIVLEEYQGNGMERAHGLSVYLPTTYGRDRVRPGLPGKGLIDPKDLYGETDTALKTRWDELLERLSQASLRCPRQKKSARG
ncbi:MAG: hypothetical protein HYU64_10160 [Armatimonadetes bacterium]|nr:hypothetical protein [Armatimonadota bacterium]